MYQKKIQIFLFKRPSPIHTGISGYDTRLFALFAAMQTFWKYALPQNDATFYAVSGAFTTYDFVFIMHDESTIWCVSKKIRLLNMCQHTYAGKETYGAE